MNTFTRSIKQIFSRAIDAFKTFPASIGCAFGFAVVTIIRIQIDWPQQEPYNFLFNCLHWSFALGAIFSLMAITGAKSRFNTLKSFFLANALGIGMFCVTFILLYMFAGAPPEMAGSRYSSISALGVARVSMAMLISYLVFVVFAGVPDSTSEISADKGLNTSLMRTGTEFSRAFFMSHKAFFISVIYGIVIMSGTSGVARAVQVLLYHDMSSKVFMYIGTLTGFLVFTMFVGYFPDFRKGENDEHREIAEKHPRFVEILFGYIMVPIVIALTAVLLLWAGKTAMAGMGANFVLLSGIAAAYTIGGIWLHIMITGYDTGIAKFYRKYYPMAALVILVFEAWALVVQLGKTGLKLTEYWFILVWIVALAGAILLIIFKARAHNFIVVITCVLAIVSVLPLVGYNVLPVNSQVERLQTLLTNENMLENNQIVPATKEPEKSVRESITDAVYFLSNANDANLPVWFNKDLMDSRTFRKTLGFDQTWPAAEPGSQQPSDYIGISLYLPAGPIDITEYRWAINMQQEYMKGPSYIIVDGDKGPYRIYWEANTANHIPILEIQLNDEVVLQKDMNDYIDIITAKYHSTNMEPKPGNIDDMTMVLESPEIKVLLIFRNIEINLDPQNDNIYYGLNIEAIYMNEKI